MNGLLLVDKPPGPTSHDVVARVREWAGTRRVGHLGTLDPAAEGLLVLCLDDALKLVPWLEGRDKEYRARLRLGVATDTQDTTGHVLAERPLAGLDPESVRAVVRALVGELEQVPPMFSARKVGGKKLVDLARAGKDVSRSPRRVVVRELEVERIEPPEVVFRARVSAGTYVRTLCHDIGARLGCGGAMAGLRRLQVGPFDVRDAFPLDRLPPAPQGIRPVLDGLGHLGRQCLSAEEVERIRTGRKIPGEGAAPGDLALVDGEGRLVAVGCRAGEGEIRPVRVL